MTPEQFERFEDARTETARLGWEPFMYNPSLGYLLEGVQHVPTLLVWGQADAVVPRGCIEAYQKALRGAQVAEIPRGWPLSRDRKRHGICQAGATFLAS